jgi:hypothetical protein
MLLTGISECKIHRYHYHPCLSSELILKSIHSLDNELYMRLPIVFLLACLLSAVTVTTHAETGTANYAYSIFVGTGKYRVGDRTIYSIRLPLAFTLKEADYDTGRFGYKFLLPMAVGITNFDSFEDLPELSIDSLQTMSVTPGLEMQIPVKANWQIKPFAQAGLGWDMTTSSNSLIWGVGARTRAWFGDNEKWLVGGEFLWAGNDPKYEDEPNTNYSRIGMGAEYKWQTNWSPFGYRVSWHGRLIQNFFTQEVTYETPPEKVTIQNSTEVGLSFGIDPPINILGYKFRQGGIGYERADGIRAIKFFTTFPF